MKGTVFIDGRPTSLHSPLEAQEAGIGTVYQDLALAPDLDIAFNLFLGSELRKPGPLGSLLRMVDRSAMRERARVAIDELQSVIPAPKTPVRGLSGGQRQAVAIARALLRARKVVVLDEPTAALGVTQSQRTLELIRRVAARGIGVLLVSHNMQEVLAVADRIVVLRRGRAVADLSAKETNMTDVVGYMTGALSAVAR